MGVLAGYNTPMVGDGTIPSPINQSAPNNYVSAGSAGTPNAVKFGDLGFNSETFDVTNPEQVGQLQGFLNKQGLYSDKALEAGGSVGDQMFGGNTEKAYQQYVNQQRTMMGNEAHTQPIQQPNQPQNSMLSNAWGNVKDMGGSIAGGIGSAVSGIGSAIGNIDMGGLGSSVGGMLGLGAQNTSEANSMSNNEANNITNSTTGVDKTDEQKGYEATQKDRKDRMMNFANNLKMPTYGGYNF